MPRSRATQSTNYSIRNPYQLFGNLISAPERFQARRYVIENLNSNITQSEFITLTAICDRTLLYGKLFECIPQRHILRTFIDAYHGDVDGYPLCRKSLSKALKSLQQKGYIIGLYHPNLDQWPKFYGINFMHTLDQSELATSCYIEAMNACCSHRLLFTEETICRLESQRQESDANDEYYESLRLDFAGWQERQLNKK